MMKKLNQLSILSILLCLCFSTALSHAQTGAPPVDNEGADACLNVFIPGMIINTLEALLTAPENIPALENIGMISRILAEDSAPNVLSVLQINFYMDIADERGDVCFSFSFSDFAAEDTEASRVLRLEQVDVNQAFADDATDCELAAGTLPNASFTLDIYADDGSDETPLDEEDLLLDFSGEADESEAPLLLISNIPEIDPFIISLSFCDESPADDPATALDESLEAPSFVAVPTLQEYCDAAELEIAESDNPDEALPLICDELIRLPENRQIFVITDTDGYFNYTVDRQ